MQVCASFRVQEDGTTSTNEATKKQMFFHNPFDSTPIALSDVASFKNIVRLCGISSASSNQQHTKIDVLISNLIDYIGTESAPLAFSKFGMNALILSPPFDVSTPKAKKKNVLWVHSQ
jgi:hypothetical protein